jgi:hypothetical protein
MIEHSAGISAQNKWRKPGVIAEKHYRRRSLDLLRTWHAKTES